jgi:hypothetical protein
MAHYSAKLCASSLCLRPQERFAAAVRLRSERDAALAALRDRLLGEERNFLAVIGRPITFQPEANKWLMFDGSSPGALSVLQVPPLPSRRRASLYRPPRKRFER